MSWDDFFCVCPYGDTYQFQLGLEFLVFPWLLQALFLHTHASFHFGLQQYRLFEDYFSETYLLTWWALRRVCLNPKDLLLFLSFGLGEFEAFCNFISFLRNFFEPDIYCFHICVYDVIYFIFVNFKFFLEDTSNSIYEVIVISKFCGWGRCWCIMCSLCFTWSEWRVLCGFECFEI